MSLRKILCLLKIKRHWRFNSLQLNIWHHFVSWKREFLVLYTRLSQQTMRRCTRTNASTLFTVVCRRLSVVIQCHLCARIRSLFSWWTTTLCRLLDSHLLQTRHAVKAAARTRFISWVYFSKKNLLDGYTKIPNGIWPPWDFCALICLHF